MIRSYAVRSECSTDEILRVFFQGNCKMFSVFKYEKPRHGRYLPLLTLTTRQASADVMSKEILKNAKIVEFQYHIRNHHEKCIQISTNMPSIGSVLRILRKTKTILHDGEADG